MSKLKIGLQLPEVEREVRWPETRAMALLAEESGFDSLWVGDHLLYRVQGTTPRAPWEAWSLLASLAAVTSSIHLGPLVASTSFHAPAMIAKKAATIDEVCNGRFILGLGAGWNESEYRAFGFHFDHRVARFEEAFTIIRTLLQNGEIDFAGDWYKVEECVLLPEQRRSGGPPLMIGSIGDRMLRATLPYVDSWNVWYADFANDADKFGEINARITNLCEELGRIPSEVERTAAVLVSVTGSTGRPSLYSDSSHHKRITGTSEDIAEQLLLFSHNGAEHLQIVLDPITIDAIEEVALAIRLAKQS
ncbi:LLM class F420-dependent oxidoreductase [soil metagenome]